MSVSFTGGCTSPIILTLSDSKSPAKKCYLNVSQRLTGKDIPIIDPKNEGKSLKDKFMRLMQTKIF
jgi:septum site-determining protein MinD